MGSQLSHSSGNGTPAYKKIQAAILKRIESGTLRVGDPVESERELAKIHGVSLMTARHALVSLEREGMVERKRGAGTFVAPPKIHFNKLMSYTEQMSGRGLSVSSKVLSFSVTNGADDLAARLGLPAGSKLIKLERLRLGGKEPFALETCYFSADEFQGLTQASVVRGSLFSILKYDYGLEISHADEEVDATIANPHTARLLGIPQDQPVLRMRQVIYSTTGKASIYVLGLYRSDRHTLFIRRYR
jgi:GntR family transcriptional regulator